MKATLAFSDGSPVLTIDGVRRAPLIYSTGVLDPEEIRRFARCGVDVVSFPATCDDHLYGLADPVWRSEDVWDYGGLDARIRLILDANPRALLLPRVYTCSPAWWDERHPGELVTWEDGATARPLYHGATKEQVPSLASRLWQARSRENLRRFVSHCESATFGDHLIGYMVNSHNSEEWFHWGVMEGYLADYGEPALTYFREWLAREYGSDAALSAAWGREVTLAAARIPDPERRRPGHELRFREPEAERDVIDFGRAFAQLTADVIGGLARTVKSETSGDKLFGTFFGYLLELAHHPGGLQNGGHLGLSRLLRNEDVDFLASPTSYGRRVPGAGYSLSMGPTWSISHRGKVFFHENDVRTHLLPDDAGYGRTENAFETITIQRREMAHALTRGLGLWWFDMTSGWYADAGVETEIRRLVGLAESLLEAPRHDVAEIALVLDEESLHRAQGSPTNFLQLVSEQAFELSRAGAPFDVVLLEDVIEECRWKLLVLPIFFHAPADLRRRFHASIARKQATALFVLAPGFAAGEAAAFEAAEALTGIRLARARDARFLLARAPCDGREITWGTRLWFGETPEVHDGDAEILGHYVDDGVPALARKPGDGWTAVWSGAPAVAGPLLRRLAREAGVHLFVDEDDAVFASDRLVALHARSAGTKSLRLPGAPTRLIDVVNDVTLRPHEGVFRFHLAYGETALLRIEHDDG